MGTSKTIMPAPEIVIESLLHSLSETFTATRDLHKTLRTKEKRDHEAIKALKGYPDSRRNYYKESDDMDEAGEEAISMDKSAVKREFQRGYDDLGHRYAIGDVITQTELQAQIIALQGTLVTVFLYGPTSPHPISHHLTTILSASKTASVNAVNSLAAQYQRMLTVLPPPIAPPSPPYVATLPPSSSRPRSSSVSRSKQSTIQPTPRPRSSSSASRSRQSTIQPSSRPRSSSASRSKPSTSTDLVPSRSSHTASHHSTRAPTTAYPTSHSPTNLTMPYPPSRPAANRSDTATTSLTGPTSISTRSPAHSLFCLYALELQHHPNQPLAPSFASPTPYCPACNRTLNLTPGRTWEVRKTDVVLDSRGRRDSAREREVERVFQVGNRFVVKCHRAGPEGGYSCVLCARDRDCEADTVAGDVKALVRHVWMEHGVRELEDDQDIVEVREEWDGDEGYGSRRGGGSSRRSF